MKRFKRISIIIFVLFFGVSTVTVSSMDIFHNDANNRIVSYQYLTECPRCGDDRMEGYHSLVDGYTEEICKLCWYYTVKEAYSDEVKVIDLAK